MKLLDQRLLPLVPGRVRIQERQRQLLSKPVNLVVPDPELRPPAIVRPPTLAERKGRSSLTIKRPPTQKNNVFAAEATVWCHQSGAALSRNGTDRGREKIGAKI